MKVSIRMAVLTVLIASILLVSMTVMYTVSNKFNDKLLTFVINDIESVVKNCQEEVTGAVINMQNENDLLSSNKEFVKLLHHHSTDVIENGLIISDIRNHISKLRTSITGDIYGSSALFFVDNSQPVSLYLESYSNKTVVPDATTVYNSKDIEKFLWYDEFKANESEITIFEDSEIPRYVFFAQYIKNYVDFNDEILGINVIGIDFENIIRDYGNIENKEFLEILIVNDEDRVVCTNDETISSEIIEFASDYKSHPELNSHSMTEVSVSGKEHYACMYDLGFDMTLVAVIPRDKVIINIQETMRDIYLFMIILLVAVLIITILLSGVIVSPIKKLSDFMETSDADKAPELKPEGSIVREIDSLYKSFNSMTRRIKRLVATAQTLGEQKKETEFRMLQAQINPHYLYNALDSISWMALKKGEDEIADMTSSLADTFRYNARTSEMIIDLGGEMEFIKNYIKLQENFRKIKIYTTITLDEATSRLKVPKFMIQPLVENSIIHGMRRDDETLTIRISAFSDDDVLEIRIEDDGNGADADKLNRYLDGDDKIFDTEKIGIINIHKRLRNKYGSNAGLRYSANQYGGLTAHIVLPKKEGEKESEIF